MGAVLSSTIPRASFTIASANCSEYALVVLHERAKAASASTSIQGRARLYGHFTFGRRRFGAWTPAPNIVTRRARAPPRRLVLDQRVGLLRRGPSRAASFRLDKLRPHGASASSPQFHASCHIRRSKT